MPNFLQIFYGKIINGKLEPTFLELKAIAKALNIPLSEIIHD
jgi:hypothetical protein